MGMKLKEALNLATLESRRAIGYRFRHGCVIYGKEGVVAKGHNKQKYHPQLRRYGYTRNCWLHAESDALLKCGGTDLRKSTLLVVRKSKTKYSNSRPCPCCMAMIRERMIRRVIYTDTLGGIVMIDMKYNRGPRFDFTKWKVMDFPVFDGKNQ